MFVNKWEADHEIYHPNINLEGKVCLNILREDWKPVLDINAVIYGLIFLFYIAIIIPKLFIIYLPFSGFSDFFANNNLFSLVSGVVILYFMFVGTFYYKVNIDPYVIQITSYKVLLDLFKKKDYVDIPHTMLRDYSFFDRPFSVNKTLMLSKNSPS